MRNIAGSVLNHSGYACQQALQMREYRRVWSAVPGTSSALLPFGVTQLAGYSSEGFPYNSGAFRLAQTGGYGYLPHSGLRRHAIRGGEQIFRGAGNELWSYGIH